MSWLWRGFQSAVFHYLSCTPCRAVVRSYKRRRHVKKDAKARRNMQMEQPEQYQQPGPTGTNPYWHEEITLGPGPPPRRSKRTNTNSSHKSMTPMGNHSALGSHAGSSNRLRLSDDEDDENWNRRRYQREDEELWGMSDAWSPPGRIRGSSVGVGGRPGTSKSSAESYTTTTRGAQSRRAESPIVVSMPSVRPADNHWMLQPPPSARIMAGKERANNRSRSGSGASSRVELSLHRQVSHRHLLRREGGATSEIRDALRSPVSQRHNRPKTPQGRPGSTASSTEKPKRKRRDTAMTRGSEVDGSSGDSADTVIHMKKPAKASLEKITMPSPMISHQGVSPTSPPPSISVPPYVSPAPSPVPSLKLSRVRGSGQRLSTVVSSGSEGILAGEHSALGAAENQRSKRHRYSSTHSSDSNPYLMMKHRSPLGPSDISSLNVLQDLVTPRNLLRSRFVSAPLVEARISLPPADHEEEVILMAPNEWCGTGSGFGVSRGWGSDVVDGQPFHSPTHVLTVPPRDPRSRWSNHF